MHNKFRCSPLPFTSNLLLKVLFLLLITINQGHILAAAGDLDLSFGQNGIVTTAISQGSTARKVAVQADGKILIAGSERFGNDKIYLARYNPNGGLDTGFGSGGVKTLTGIGFVQDLAVQFDDKILLAANNSLFRFNSNGSTDFTFGTQGRVNIATNSIAFQSDGKIILAGVDVGLNVTRLNYNGAVDTTFGSGGRAAANIGNSSRATLVLTQPDDKIIVGGYYQPDATTSIHIALVRYNSNGILDNTFDEDGKVTTVLNDDNSRVNSAVIQPDGKIVVAVGAGLMVSGRSGVTLVRYVNNGSLDQSFDSDGISTIFGNQFYFDASILLLQTNGKLAVVGTNYSQGFGFSLVRFQQSGSQDTSFGRGNGFVRTEINDYASMNDALIQSDGKIIVAGTRTREPNITDFAAARYLVRDSAKSDFDGDGKSDISVFRPANGTWHILQSSNNSYFGTGFGASGDRPVSSDFDGDGKADIGLFRPASGYWYRINSSNNQFSSVLFGQAGDTPTAGDFDGDGKADVGVFRPSSGSWFRLNSSNNQFSGVQFGANGDIPLIADFDGDGKSDISVYRPSNGAWYVLQSSNGSFFGVGFGTSEDLPVPADFDGDGKTDIAVFRPSNGNWYRLNSSNNQFVSVPFGISEDMPVPADYDGDGKTDIAVFRPSNGVWYILGSTSNFYSLQFGLPTDVPTLLYIMCLR